MDETEVLAENVERASYDDIPADAVADAKQAIRDVVGVAIYGSHHEVGDLVTGYVERSFGDGEATLIGRGTTTAPGAALVNGSYAHAIDYDDTFESIVIHPSGPVFSATLAATEMTEGSGTDLLTGYVVGVEAAYRVGHSTYPNHYDHGWHSTGTAGSFGAAAAAGSVLGLSVAELRNAFAVVASSSSSLKKNFGSMTKPLHPGHAAQMGVRATLLAEAGFTGDEAIFEGEMGYGNVMTPDGSYDPEAITEGWGDEWAVSEIGFKPYPSGVISHAAMDALRSIVLEHDFSPDDVDRITVTLEEAANEMLIHAEPENALQAKFSIEFCLAAILRERDAGVREFSDEYVTAPETRREIEKVDRDFETNLFGGDFAGYGARVVVETADGETYIGEEKRAPGSPSNPVSEDRLLTKFTNCAEAVLDADDAAAAANAIEELDADGALDRMLTAVKPT
jgi:2-methylcitrate dehydratase PrpD